MMSCAQKQRPMAYCTFHDTELRDYIEWMWTMFTKHQVTVGQLFKMILKYCDTCSPKETTLLAFFEKEFGEQLVTKENMSIDDSQSSKLDEVLLQTSPDMFSDDKDDTIADADSIRISQSMRLFTEMEKIYQNSGSLNLTDPRSSEEMDVAVSPDVKKKVTKKITDYFAKKS